MVERLTEERLRPVLGDRPFRFYPQIGSTNDVAREWAESGGPHGAIVITEEQTAGRGRFAHRWQAPPETGLLFSLIVSLDKIRAEMLNILPLTIGVAVAEALEKFGVPEVKLKWPNDVLINGRKVAGILSEAIWNGQTPVLAIVGIGLNVRVDFSGTELAEHAISLEPASGRPVDRAELLASLLDKIEQWFNNSSPILATYDAYGRRNTLRGGRRVTIRFNENDTEKLPITGEALNIDLQGRLIVTQDDGEPLLIHAGEVTLS